MFYVQIIATTGRTFSGEFRRLLFLNTDVHVVDDLFLIILKLIRFQFIVLHSNKLTCNLNIIIHQLFYPVDFFIIHVIRVYTAFHIERN